MPTVFILIGVTGVGKSTWALHNIPSTYEYISSDMYIEDHARNTGKTYTEVFPTYVSTAIELMWRDVKNAYSLGKNIVWDQTNTTIASRRKKIEFLIGYNKVALVFTTPPIEELYRRLEMRPNKIIPKNILQNMINGWEEPSIEEGWDDIRYI